MFFKILTCIILNWLQFPLSNLSSVEILGLWFRMLCHLSTKSRESKLLVRRWTGSGFFQQMSSLKRILLVSTEGWQCSPIRRARNTNQSTAKNWPSNKMYLFSPSTETCILYHRQFSARTWSSWQQLPWSWTECTLNSMLLRLVLWSKIYSKLRYRWCTDIYCNICGMCESIMWPWSPCNSDARSSLMIEN